MNKQTFFLAQAKWSSVLCFLLFLFPLNGNADADAAQTISPSDPSAVEIAKNTLYPQIHRKLGVQGSVLLQYSVDTNGKAFNIRVLDGNDASFTASAINSLRATQFDRPAVNGITEVLTNQKRRYTFELFNLEQTEQNDSADVQTADALNESVRSRETSVLASR